MEGSGGGAVFHLPRHWQRGALESQRQVCEDGCPQGDGVV
jgi:hypothetical protein